MDKSKQILTEVLLELTILIGSHKDYEDICNHTLSLWLSRLNCIVAGILKFEGDYLTKHNAIPMFVKNQELPIAIKGAILNHDIDEYTLIEVESDYCYIYNIGYDRYLYFKRKAPLNIENCKDLVRVTNFLGNALDHASERELRLKAEQDLKRERRLLQTVIDHVPDTIYLKDKNLNKLFANKADVVLSGLQEKEDLIYKTDREIYPEHIYKETEAIDKEVINTGLPLLDKVEKIENNKGQLEWLSTSKIPFKDEEGNVVGIVGIGRNITNQIEIQERIKRLSLVASQSTNGVIITDVLGRVEWINDGFTRLTGFTIDEVKGKSPGHFLQGEDSDEKVKKIMSKAIKNKVGFDVDIVNYKKDGTPYIINIVCNPLKNDSGEVTGFMAIESDKTEKVRNREELIKAKQVAEKAKDAEEAFLASMSHEIRTPLNSIIGMTNLLKDTNLDGSQIDLVSNLDYSSNFLLSLISDILDLSKIESGKVEPRPISFNIKNLLEKVIQTFKANNKKEHLQFELLLGAGLDDNIVSDKILLLQVINNLMSNAYKFTNEGMITVICKKTNIQGDLYLDLSVRDTGIGLTKEDQDNLFIKFNQFGALKNSINKGSGLGLCITKEIVGLLGGQIQVESEINHGTKFTFQIPYEQDITVMEKSNETQVEQSTNGSSIEDHFILVAEDNFMNQKYINKLMAKFNVKYDLAKNGLEAVELSLKNKYSIIFMDVQMPEMDGYEATTEIRKSSNPNESTPIVALTASAFISDKEKAFEFGMSDFLSKPFTPAQLKEVLEKYVSK